MKEKSKPEVRQTDGIRYRKAYEKGVVDVPIKTLRDEFAMAALTQLFSMPGDYEPELLASIAYSIADAMMEARSRAH